MGTKSSKPISSGASAADQYGLTEEDKKVNTFASMLISRNIENIIRCSKIDYN